MPRIQKPSTEVAVRNAREFALLTTMDPEQTGQVDAETLLSLGSRYGDANRVNELAKKDEISFDDFVAATKRIGEKVAGEGNCVGWAARDASGTLSPFKFTRRAARADDVHIKITYAGMCHSDVHQIRGEWGNSTFPMVPGHEIIGVVVEVGPAVTKFKVGDFAGVGCMVDSCQNCKSCAKNEEQYCPGMVATYNGKDKNGEVTHGGYSTHILVREAFTLRVPPSVHVPGGAPLLCAGITVWSPMKFYGADKAGMRLGVVGLGGLGHMAVKFGKKFGQHVTVISRNNKKRADALEGLGADDFLAMDDADAVAAAAGSFDAIIDTVSANHDINQLLSFLEVDGKLLLVGVPPEPYALAATGLIFGRKMVAGSLIGGIQETQEMLDFCGEHGVVSTSEVIPISDVNEAVDRLVAGDVKYRFVIDVQGSLLLDA